MTRRTPLIALLLLTLAVTGCANTPTPAATSAAGSPSATPTPTPTPTPVGPLAAFDGDCTQVLTAAQRDSILGPGSEARSSLWPGPTLLAGGVSCRWEAASDADLPEGMGYLTVEIYPESVVAQDVRTALAEPRCDPQYDSSSCREARSVNGVWVMVRAGYLLGEPVAEMSLALDAVTANLAGEPVPVAATATEEWWTIPDCDAFGEQLGLSEILGEGYHSGYWEGSTQFEDLILAGAGVRQFCQYSSSYESVPDGYEFMILSVTVEPGGALTWDDEAVLDEVPVEVAGAAQAFSRPTRGVRATDGMNTVSVMSEGDDVGVMVAERVIAELGG